MEETLTKEKIEKEIEEIYKEFMDAYFTKRDIDKASSFLSREFKAIGTGRDEETNNIEEAKKLFQRELKQAPDSIHVHFYSLSPYAITEDVGMILSDYKIEAVIDNIPFELDFIRSTVILKKEKGVWKILHSHISIPFIMQKEGESFPIEALKSKNRLLQQVVSEKTEELGKIMEELERLASTDKLTGLYNRNKFDQLLNYEIERTKRYNTSFSILMFDIDSFKEINDTSGHIIGDKILNELSQFIKSKIRKVDIFARWGGDEFVILLPSTDIEGAKKFAEKIRKEVEMHKFNAKRRLTLSIGVTEYVKDEDSASLIRRVDKCLYEAKKAGKNTVKVS